MVSFSSFLFCVSECCNLSYLSLFRTHCLHRDLKPENVLVSEFITGKISDFGASRAKDAHNMNMTTAGTPAFAAPEIFRGEGRYSEKVDVYSFGIVLVEVAVVTGGLPKFVLKRWQEDFPSETKSAEAIFNCIWDGSWHPLTADNGACLSTAPSRIQGLAARCCAFDPRARPSFSEILDFLSGPVANELIDSNTHFIRTSVTSAAAAATAPRRVSNESFAPVLGTNTGVSPLFHNAALSSVASHGKESPEEHAQRKSAHHVHISSSAVSPAVRNMVAASNRAAVTVAEASFVITSHSNV